MNVNAAVCDGGQCDIHGSGCVPVADCEALKGLSTCFTTLFSNLQLGLKAKACTGPSEVM